MSSYLMHTALLVKSLDGGTYLSARQLFYDLPQLWIALPYDVIQRSRPHPCLLQLCERTACFDGLMLAAVSYQQHTIIPMETFDELVHLARRGKRGFIEHIQALLSSVGLRPFRKVSLESRGLRAGLSKPVGCARRRRESFHLVPLRFGTFAYDSERRCFSCPGNAIQPDNLLSTDEDLIHRFAL